MRFSVAPLYGVLWPVFYRSPHFSPSSNTSFWSIASNDCCTFSIVAPKIVPISYQGLRKKIFGEWEQAASKRFFRTALHPAPPANWNAKLLCLFHIQAELFFLSNGPIDMPWRGQRNLITLWTKFYYICISHNFTLRELIGINTDYAQRYNVSPPLIIPLSIMNTPLLVLDNWSNTYP